MPHNKLEVCLYITHKHLPIHFESSLDHYETYNDINAACIIVMPCYLGKNNRGKSEFSTDTHFRNIFNFFELTDIEPLDTDGQLYFNSVVATIVA